MCTLVSGVHCIPTHRVEEGDGALTGAMVGKQIYYKGVLILIPLRFRGGFLTPWSPMGCLHNPLETREELSNSLETEEGFLIPL